MSRVLLEIDESLPRRELFKFLKENKKQLIAQKKAAFKKFDTPNFIMGYTMDSNTEHGSIFKAATEAEIPESADSLMVTVVANTSMYCDTSMDVLLRDAGKKSMKERKGLIPHIHDHLWETDAEVGDVKSIYYQDVPLKTLGYKTDGTAQALTFETEIIKDYNERIFKKYRQKKVKQHSIGLRYMDLLLAINEPEDDYWADEYKIWKKYIDQIINKELPESVGYFWAVPQFMLLENSCVLLGANPLTPTLSTSEKSDHLEEPPTDESKEDSSTHERPEEKDDFDVSAFLKTHKFF